jgi:putative addiction module component (TIGR02574 family)
MILTKEELAKIPREKKYELMGEIWESLQNEQDFELTEEQKRILDERIKFAEENPDAFLPWEEVREKLHEYLNDAD